MLEQRGDVAGVDAALGRHRCPVGRPGRRRRRVGRCRCRCGSASVASASASSLSPAIWARRARIVARCQFKIGWSSRSASDQAISKQRSISSMSPARRASAGAEVGGPEQQDRVTDALGDLEGLGRPGQRLLEQVRHESGNETWLRTRTMVASSPEDRAMARASSASAWRRSRLLAVGELGAEGGEHEGRAGSSVGSRSRASSRISTLSASTVPAVENMPRLLARAAATSRSVSPRSAARRAASRRVSRKAGSPGLALGGAEPDGQVDAQDRIGVVGPGVEVEGLGVVAEGVAGGERGERGVAGPPRVVEGLGQVDGLGGADQWRASSPTRDPGRSPQRSSSASATCRCARARRVGPRSSYRVCWMRAWAKL